MSRHRNLKKELEDMGMVDENEEWNELERRDAEHQAAACREQYHKDVRDFIVWRKANAPQKSLAKLTQRLKQSV